MDVEDAKLLRTSDEVWRYLSIPAMAALDSITQRIAGANTSPLLQLRAIGNDIISAGLAVKGTMFALAGFAGSRASDWSLGNVFSVSEALKTISGFVEFLSSGILASGLVLAYYLPAIPSIWFMLAAIRWLAGVAEAVLAAPLMAAFIMAPSGDDTVGRAGPGMLLIAGLVFMPVLIIGGLILSILMTYPAGALVNATFMAIVSGTSGASGVGLTGLLAYSALYMLMMVVAMHACMALIQAVPDAVMRYVGGQAGPGLHVADSGQGAPQELKEGSKKAGSDVVRGGGDRHSGGAGGGKGGGGASQENGFTHSNKDLLG
jgi:conjugal transfer/type IV secretion protein DotA/TraY